MSATLGFAVAAPAAAQGEGEGAVADDAATQQNAIANINLMLSALNSDGLDESVKQTLVGCIYRNSMRDITVAMDESIAANPGQFDRSDTSSMLSLMAGVCGYQPDTAQNSGQDQAEAPSR